MRLIFIIILTQETIRLPRNDNTEEGPADVEGIQATHPFLDEIISPKIENEEKEKSENKEIGLLQLP